MFGSHPLHFGVNGRRILVGFDDLGDRRKDKPGGAGEGVGLQLPDAVHDDVRGPHRPGDQAAGAGVADLELFAGITDQNGVEADVERAKAGLAGGLPESRFNELAIEPQLLARFNLPALLRGGQQQFDVRIGGDKRANTGSRARSSRFITSHSSCTN